MTNMYTYIRPQNLKDIADELRKIVEYKKYEELNNLILHIDLYVKEGLDIFDREEVEQLLFDRETLESRLDELESHS